MKNITFVKRDITSHGLKRGLCVFLFTFMVVQIHASMVVYTYDTMNRLSKIIYLNSTTIVYNYDPVGNWTTNTVLVAVDSDSDCISDWWMTQYLGHTTGQAGDKSRAADDADGDGMTNLQEFLAGTNPRSAASVLRISNVTRQGNDMVFSFPTATNRLYVLEWTTDLTNRSWTSLPGLSSGDGSVQQVTHVGGAGLPKRFYRIRLLN